MHILFISLTCLFNSYSASLRNYSLVFGLLQNGHRVDVLTFPCDKNNPRFIELSQFDNLNVTFFPLTSSIISKVYTSKSRSFLFNIARFFFSRLSLFEFTPSSIWKSSFLHTFNASSYDVLISSSDPKVTHRYGSSLLRFLHPKPFWIQYWGDPFTNDISSSHLYPRFLLKPIERLFLQDSDLSVFTSPFTNFVQKEQYPSLSHKFLQLPTPSPTQIIPHLRTKNFKISYHGTYSPSIRNIVPLIEAFSYLPPTFELEIIGPKISSIVNQFSDSSNISFFDHQQDLVPFIETTDLLVVILNLSGTQVPGKLFHYAGINRPILVCSDGENGLAISKFFEQYSRFHIVDNISSYIAQSILSISRDSNSNPCFDNPFEPSEIASHLLDQVNLIS